MRRVLIVDDEGPIRRSLGGILSDEGFEVAICASGEEALGVIENDPPDLILLDIWMPGIDGLIVLEKIKTIHPNLPVIMISGHGTLETAIKATRLGAFDFIEKPLDTDKILLSLRNALEVLRLTEENLKLRGNVPKLTGSSPAMQELRSRVEMVAGSDSWVLILGENGTGKELIAQSIHYLSARAKAPLVEVNCAAIPEDLIESELFGHEKGAFTGATSRRQGRFDLADSGTIFLDEIADMSLKAQAKVLRILQEKKFERVGGQRTITVDVRVIAATNKDLSQEMKEGRFREDLYYRLNVVPLEIPSLRERVSDIPELACDFLAELAQNTGQNLKRLTPEVLEAMMQYNWPGNVRELKNLIERLVIMTKSQLIGMNDLPSLIFQTNKAGDDLFWQEVLNKDYRQAKAFFEKIYFERKLKNCDNNITNLAKATGLERSHLYKKFKSLNIITD